MNIILPNYLFDDHRINAPIFFLAGPVSGGGDWQSRCCWEINRYLKDCFIVVPCRWDSSHEMYQYRYQRPTSIFNSQTHWEHYYLELTAERSKEQKGCILFWLPAESKNHPRTDGQPYARDTRGEIGAWRVRLAMNRSIQLVMGADPTFPGLKVIQKNFDLDLPDAEFYIHETLEATVRRAVSRIKL